MSEHCGLFAGKTVVRAWPGEGMQLGLQVPELTQLALFIYIIASVESLLGVLFVARKGEGMQLGLL